MPLLLLAASLGSVGTPACGSSWSSCCTALLAGTSCRWSRARLGRREPGPRAAGAPGARADRGGRGAPRGERLPGGAARRRAGLTPRSSLAGRRGSRYQRHVLRRLRRLARVRRPTRAGGGGGGRRARVEVFRGSTGAFDARLHARARPPGPARGPAAARVARRLTRGAAPRRCGRVQDPYTLRCAPQVLGAIADALAHIGGALERELTRSPTTRSFSPTTTPCSRRATSTGSRWRCRSTTSAGDDRARALRRAPHLRAPDAVLRRICPRSSPRTPGSRRA